MIAKTLLRFFSTSRATAARAAAEGALDPTVASAVAVLDQQLQLVDVLAEQGDPRLWDKAAAHLRHCADHYSKAVQGISATAVGPNGVQALQVVDYDRRARNTAMEASPAAARRALEGIRGDLMELGTRTEGFPADGEIEVSFMLVGGSGDNDEDYNTLSSTCGREIAFAAHHAIHHNAYVKLVLEAAAKESSVGLVLPEGFGLAPSTAAFNAAANHSLSTHNQ